MQALVQALAASMTFTWPPCCRVQSELVCCAAGQQHEVIDRQPFQLSSQRWRAAHAIFPEQQTVRRPKALFLDACGTFLIPSESVTDVYRRYAELHGVPASHLANHLILQVPPPPTTSPSSSVFQGLMLAVCYLPWTGVSSLAGASFVQQIDCGHSTYSQLKLLHCCRFS